MPTGTVQKQHTKKIAIKAVLPSRIRMEQEMMTMREVDRWMAEHERARV